MSQFENPAAIDAVSALKYLTCLYLLGELDRNTFQTEQRRLLSDLAPARPDNAAARALVRYFGDLEAVDEADETNAIYVSCQDPQFSGAAFA